MRALALLFFTAGILGAQPWNGRAQDVRSADTVWVDGRPVGIQVRPTLGTLRLEHSTWGVLPMPTGLGRLDAIRPWKDCLWAFGERAHPATQRATQVPGWSRAPADRVLLRSRDGRNWELTGRLRTHQRKEGGPPFPVLDSARIVQDLIPLENGACLAWGRFQQGGVKSFFARYRVEVGGDLVFERLVELPRGWDAAVEKPSSLPKFLEDPFGAVVSWRMARSPRGILCLHRESSLAVLLDNRDGRILESRVLFPGQPWEAESRPWNRAVLEVQPLADGSFLLATPDLSWARTRVPMSREELETREAVARLTPSTRLALARLFGRAEDTRVPAAVQALHWYRYLPGEPLQGLEAPKGFPARVVSLGAYQAFSFTFRPDGGLVLGPGLEARGTVVR